VKYRREIDGLRAVAVLLVIIYNAGFTVFGDTLFAGGYVGVDVFFVISGFLISSILLREMEEIQFTFIGFYDRRARRILPVLFLVMFATLPFAWRSMLSDPFKDYAQSILSSTLFTSNFLFWMEGDYGNQAGEFKPFIHTWSLSIEEQFYVFFPIVLLWCVKLAKKYITLIFIVGILISLVLAEGTIFNPNTKFYLLHTRLWELLAGALLAKFSFSNSKIKSSYLYMLMPFVGLSLIIYAAISFGPATNHPGLITLIPVVGSMLIIQFGGKDDWISRILSTKAFVGVGLISYSLYLWHYPIFAFSRIMSTTEITDIDKFKYIILSFVLAMISWRFVEQPFRNKKTFPRKKLFSILFISSAVFVIFGSWGHFSNGYPDRLPAFFRHIDKMPKPFLVINGKNCRDIINFSNPVKDACVLGGSASGRNWVLVGDSHMSFIQSAMWEAVEKRNENLTLLTQGGCLYVQGTELVSQKNEVQFYCKAEFNDKRRKRILSIGKSIVVVGGRYPLYLTGKYFGNFEGGVETGDDYPKIVPVGKLWTMDESERVNQVIKLFQKSIEELLESKHKVVLLYPIPEVEWHVPNTLKNHYYKKGPFFTDWIREKGLTIPYEAFKERTMSSYRMLDSIEDHPNLLRIYPEDIFCAKVQGRCSTHDATNIYYKDHAHLSLSGGRLLFERIMKESNIRWGFK